MKYLGYFEWNYDDIERIGELWKELLDDRERDSEKWPKTLLFDTHTLEADLFDKTRDNQSFWIFETDDPMHLINYRMHFAPYVDFNFIPLTENKKKFETWMGLKK